MGPATEAETEAASELALHPIALRRLANRWSVGDLARKVEASENAVLGWEMGVVVREGRVPQLAQLFGMRPAELRRELAEWESARHR
jgi:hypothetical protein